MKKFFHLCDDLGGDAQEMAISVHDGVEEISSRIVPAHIGHQVTGSERNEHGAWAEHAQPQQETARDHQNRPFNNGADKQQRIFELIGYRKDVDKKRVHRNRQDGLMAISIRRPRRKCHFVVW